MKRVCIRIMTVCLAMLFSFSAAFGWGSATHAYIAERLNSKLPYLTLNQVYGSMAPDIFNLMPPPTLSCLTHCNYFMEMWRLPALPAGKALAFGFVSHNQAWGADFFAHNPGCCGDVPNDGYIFAKAQLLDGVLSLSQDYLALTQNLDPAVKMELLRDVVEYGVDILIKRADPAIGAKLMFAGLFRSPEFPLMLAAAYADDVSGILPISRADAAKLIVEAESEFQQTTIGYGQLLTLPENQALAQLATQLTALAGAYGIPPEAEPLIAQALQTAMMLCAGDYKPTLKTTIDELGKRMQERRIRY
jgi:hypothetical protein